MKRIIFLILSCSMLSHAQKTIEKSILVNQHTSTVVIDLEQVFSINLKSTKKNIISLKAISEGEYAPHFIITEEVRGNVISLTGSIAFTYPNNQDKLSAHKVHAIAIELTVPEKLNTIIKSDIGNLNVIGIYQSLIANLKSGNCVLNDASGHMTIQTVNGNIHLTTKNGKVSAESKTGLVQQEVLADGNSVFELKTIKGDINIEQSK